MPKRSFEEISRKIGSPSDAQIAGPNERGGWLMKIAGKAPPLLLAAGVVSTAVGLAGAGFAAKNLFDGNQAATVSASQVEYCLSKAEITQQGYLDAPLQDYRISFKNDEAGTAVCADIIARYEKSAHYAEFNEAVGAAYVNQQKNRFDSPGAEFSTYKLWRSGHSGAITNGASLTPFEVTVVKKGDEVTPIAVRQIHTETKNFGHGFEGVFFGYGKLRASDRFPEAQSRSAWNQMRESPEWQTGGVSSTRDGIVYAIRKANNPNLEIGQFQVQRDLENKTSEANRLAQAQAEVQARMQEEAQALAQFRGQTQTSFEAAPAAQSTVSKDKIDAWFSNAETPAVRNDVRPDMGP